MFRSGAKTLTISNEEMNDILKIVKSLEESGLLIKGVSETIKNAAKDQKGGFLGMLLTTLGASLSGEIYEQIKEQLEQVKVNLELVKVLLEQVRIFNAASSFNKFWNTKVLPKGT